jgi:superfamily II DNA or RNA helicase
MDSHINLYNIHIFEKYNDLINSGKNIIDFNNYDLCLIFEYLTCIKLSIKFNQKFFVYDDITSNFKEDNDLSQSDTGIDASNLIDTIVQCKLRKNNLNLKECSTFFASQNTFDNNINKIIVKWNNLILYRNSESILSNNLQFKLDKKMFIDKDLSRQDILDYCNNLLINKPQYPIYNNKIILRDYQIEAINLINNNNKTNIILNIPTGCGKNIILAESLNINHKTLILVPRIILMEQLKDVLLSNYPQYKHNIQCIGNKHKKFDNRKFNITICVFNSVILIQDFLNKFDRIYIDEAHHIHKPLIYSNKFENLAESTESTESTESNENSKEYDEDFKESDESNEDFKESDESNEDSEEYDEDFKESDESNEDSEEYDESCVSNEDFEEYDEYCEYDDNSKESDDNSKESCESNEDSDDIEDELQNTKKYTQIIKNLAQYNNNILLSATIDKIDGFEFFYKDIRNMINQNYLCDYNIKIPIFSNDPNNINICKYLLNKYRNIIIYCNTRSEGKKINKLFNELQNKSSEYIDCNTSKTKRNLIINNFKSGKLPFLVNVRILVEGFDAPITKGVCFLHMPSSKTTLIQIIGRALRLHPLKNIANIILPCSSNEDCKHINKFIKIMADNDSRIKQSYNNKKLGGYISIDNINESDENVKDISLKYELIYNNLGELQNSEEIWDFKFQKLKEFIDKNGKRPHYKNNKKIYIWMLTQLMLYKNKIKIMKNKDIYYKFKEFIEDEKYKELFLTYEDLWEKNLIELKKFINIYNKKPNTKHKNKNIKRLGVWASVQQQNYKNKIGIIQNKKLYNKWTEFINDIKYTNLFLTNIEIWLNKLEELKKFININKKLPSTLDKTTKIGVWLSQHQTNYRLKINIMKNKKIYNIWSEFINNKNYIDYLCITKIWSNKLQILKDYININKKLPTETLNLNLNKWLLNQHTSYKTNKMKNIEIYNKFKEFIEDEKYKELFLTDEEKWLNKFQKLKDYIDINNKRPTEKNNNLDIIKLSRWVSDQQRYYKNKIITMKNKEKYDMWSEFINNIKYKKYFLNNTEVWLNKLKELKKFIDLNNAKPIQKITIGKWLANQHKNYKNQSDSMNNIENYNKWTEFINDDKYKTYFLTDKEKWFNKLEELKKYINKNNKKPTQKIIIGKWLSQQIVNYNKNKNCMKNKEIYNKWIYFINNDNYKDYF